jgi:hypothetical protein
VIQAGWHVLAYVHQEHARHLVVVKSASNDSFQVRDVAFIRVAKFRIEGSRIPQFAVEREGAIKERARGLHRVECDHRPAVFRCRSTLSFCFCDLLLEACEYGRQFAQCVPPVSSKSGAQLNLFQDRAKPLGNDNSRMIPACPLEQVPHFSSHDSLAFVATICGTQTG